MQVFDKLNLYPVTFRFTRVHVQHLKMVKSLTRLYGYAGWSKALLFSYYVHPNKNFLPLQYEVWQQDQSHNNTCEWALVIMAHNFWNERSKEKMQKILRPLIALHTQIRQHIFRGWMNGSFSFLPPLKKRLCTLKRKHFSFRVYPILMGVVSQGSI